MTAISCAHCTSNNISKRGTERRTTGKVQRYKCSDCNKNFYTPLTKAPSAQTSPAIDQRVLVQSDTPITFAVFTDSHFDSVAGKSDTHSILEQIVRETKPDYLVNNGDALDFPTISSHPSLDWDNRPSVASELQWAQRQLQNLSNCSPSSKCIWTLGNHDARFNKKLADSAKEFQNIPGFSIKHHFQDWQFAHTFVFNDALYFVHNLRGGVNAGRNNAVNAGISTVTGHFHRLNVSPVTNILGDRIYGIEAGFAGNPDSELFDYCQGRLKDWQEGFVFITLDGKDVRVEQIEVKNGAAWFRGKKYYA